MKQSALVEVRDVVRVYTNGHKELAVVLQQLCKEPVTARQGDALTNKHTRTHASTVSVSVRVM